MKRLMICLLLALCLTACAARQEHTTPEPAQSDTATESAAPAQEPDAPAQESETPEESAHAAATEELTTGGAPDEELESQIAEEAVETGEEVTTAPGEVPDEEMEPQPLSAGITADEFDSFGVTVPGVADTVKDFRPFSETMESDFLGTWYDPELGEAIRLTEDGAYVYIPYLDCFGDELYRWELVDRSESGKCPKLAIYCFEGGPLAYYVAGNAGDYFWCISQGQVFYRQ